MTARELADSTRLLLRAAALEETFAQPELVAQVADLSHTDLAAALAEAREHDILRLDRDSEMLRFRHALLREAVADEMLAGERRALHRRWGEALDQVAEATGSRASLVVGRARQQQAQGREGAGMTDLGQKADDGAERVAHENGFVKPEHPREGDHIVRQRLEGSPCSR